MSPAPRSIRVVSASAGSGKTHRLVNEIEAAITDAAAPVRPEAIVATTFTVKAAAELRERVRTRLLEKGHVELAQRLGAARIGTVNSVCGQLVTEFAFDLGISPESRVLGEDEAKQAFVRALSGLVSMAKDEDGRALTAGSDAAAALMELEERWPGLEWLEDVQTIAEKARENGLAPDAVRACAARSAESLLAYFGPAAAGGEPLERGLERALAAFEPAALDTTKATAELQADMEKTLARLRAGRPLSWRDWSSLAAAEPGARSRAAFEPVREAARGHERHPAVRDEVRRCVAAAFELAARALEAYERHKRDWGVLDFVDQEVLALRLLRQPAVQDMLREQVDLVLVDEFQDTSPLQLEIFLELAKLAPRSFWVGDQKQAIYGFRGTDPALMDVAIAAIQQAGGSGENLPYSYRSRAELVRLTSDVFAPAFAAQGITRNVRLEPAAATLAREDRLGAVVEGWRLDVHDRKKAPDAQALAVALRELMNDPGALVRDVLTNEARRVRPGDVAVLCRSSANCARVTDALEAAGIPAVRPRMGLVDTLEARVVLAALRLWVDPKQPLAAAELGRLLVDAGDADAWLARVLEEPGEAYATDPVVGRLRTARERLPLGGPLVAFDAALEAVGARECCLRWGNEAQRLGNLDALRAAAHGYVATCEVEGIAATVAGLVAHFEASAGGWGEERIDEQATLSGADAVTVGTLHSAKGLEWPVTVLFELDSTWTPSAFGVHVESDRETFDFEAPLAGRWIRYWPDPYASAAGPWGRPHPGKTPVHERIADGAEHAAVARREERETLRLLYVGWTRARDRVVFAARPGKLVGGTLDLLRATAGFGEPEAQCTWGGRGVQARVRTTQPLVPEPVAPEAGTGYDAAGPREHPAAVVNMSKVAGTGKVGPVEPLGSAPPIQEPVDWNALGNATHAFFAADRDGLEPAERTAIARRMLEGWSVQGSLAPEALVASADALRAWIARRWPDAAWQREWPLRLRREDGTELVGYADLVLASGEEFVLVDHKCLGGPREKALAEAAGYAGQLGAYATAIAQATGRRAAGCWLHLVAQGLVVGVEVPEAGRR